MTVLVWGVPSEAPVAMVTAALASHGADVLVVHPREFREQQVEVGVAAGQVIGSVRARGRTVGLDDVEGVYVRPVEPELLPADSQPAGPPSGQARLVYDALVAFTEVAGMAGGRRIANRLSSMASNMSKPYQAQAVLRHGFATPETLVSDDPDEVLEFARRHGGLVYKSTSGIRSVVTRFDPVADRDRLDRLRWCPVQFQELLRGPDVRVHVVGDEVYPALVHSDAVDYRYAMRQVGADARLSAYRLPDDVAQRCVELATDLDLPFAGIDLKLATDGRVVCFEVNPSPGFPWYEHEAGLPISAAVARWLTADSRPRGITGRAAGS
jgi:ribosomal protein S6-L-glutamate ligase RimK-like protein